jgi:hypothetical protein
MKKRFLALLPLLIAFSFLNAQAVVIDRNQKPQPSTAPKITLGEIKSFVLDNTVVCG